METEIIKLLTNKMTNNLTINEISSILNIEIEDCQKSVEELEKEGIVFHNKNNKYTLLSNTSLKKGIIKITKRKGPIVVLEDKTELILKYNSHSKVNNNDIALVEPLTKSGMAQLVKVLERKYEDYTGEIVQDGKYYKVISPKHEDIFLKEAYPVGTIVLIDGKTNTIKEIVGHKDEPDIKTKSVLLENGFPIKFSEEYEKELEEVPSSLTEEYINEEKQKGRYDLRNLPTVTIDGSDTKDIDDSCCYYDNTLYIPIADVTNYIKEGTVMETETITRGTSVYPPGMVNPMTHHKLSSGICSLNPNEDRLSVTLILKLDDHGNVLSYKIKETITRSKMKMTYEDVNLFLEEKIIVPEYAEYITMLDKLYSIAMKMKKKMLNEGFLEFTSDEVKFHFDEARKITGIKGRHQGKAEELIEFLMLLHNMTVTNYFVSHELPFVARNHDKPNQEKLLAWNSLLGQRGYKIDNKKNFTNEDIRKRLESYEGKDEQVILDNLAVRSQSKAGYGANSIGHYALGFENYATFTSPIRRLADFINQRVLKDSIHYGDKYAIEKWTPKMEYLAKIATDTERNAEKVERKMTDIRKAEYMSEHIGDKWTGLVSEVGYNYIKVILPNMIQGKVFISSKDYILSKDYFSLTSKDGSERILVGDKINVQAVKADIDTGEITFIRQSTKVRSNNEEKESCKKRVKKR